jgi:hypothetical protein
MEAILPIVLITPEAQKALEAEAERSGVSGDVVGGILLGYPVDERRRLVVSSIRPRPEVGFGRKDFCLDQSRTSQQLADAKKSYPKAHYCGVWYVHRTPTGELTDEEWVVTQGILEDPDFRFKDLVCLVVCLYGGKLNTYALSFNRYHSARGQLPVPTVLKLDSEAGAALEPAADTAAAPSSPRTPAPPPEDWYKTPEAVARLEDERARLLHGYRVESAVGSGGKVVFRLMPHGEHQDMVFYLACEAGFPDNPPLAFLVVRGDRYPLLSPALSEWSADKRLADVADDLVKWQVALLDQQVQAAHMALEAGDARKASDLLAMVLLIEPRKAGVARLLARAESMMAEQ